jgi:hypothetical protein
MDPDDANNPAHRIDVLAELAGRATAWILLIGLAVALLVWLLRRTNARPSVPPGWEVGAAGASRWRFNPPPGWPPTPPGFVPPAGWRPDPSWPFAPPGWQWWVPN